MKTITVDNNEKAYECKSNPNYYITESGDIYSILVKGGRGKKDINNPRKLCYGQDKDGYYRVVLSENKKKRYVKNHTLIAEQFIGKVEHPYVVNHKNGKKKDNDVSNLEIVTVKENTIHAFENNLVDISKRSNVTNVDVVYNNEVYNFPSIESCVNHFPELGKTYIKHIMNEDQNFNLIKFEKVNKDSKYSPVNAYYNGELYCTFSSAKEAGLYFGKKGKDVSQSYHAIYPDKVNQYKLSFPNVTTIESKEITSPISFYK